MKVHYVIVLIKLCLDAGNDFSIILCSFGSFLVRGFKVISHKGGPPKYHPPPPHPPRSQEARKRQL